MRNLILILLLISSSTIVRAEELDKLESENRRLRAEYELAAKPQVYFVFDLPAKKVLFKASGMAIAELPLSLATVWGQVGEEKIRTVVAKESLFTPQRDVLKIPPPEQSESEESPEPKPKAEPKKFELAALELSDMPSAFRLRLDDGLLISVKPVPEGFFRRQLRNIEKGAWFVSRPLISDWNFLHKKTYTEILLTMSTKDAQLLYWSLTDGSSCLLIN